MQKIKNMLKRLIKKDSFVYKALSKIYHLLSTIKYRTTHNKEVKKETAKVEEKAEKQEKNETKKETKEEQKSEDLETKTLAELKAMAKEKELKGYSTMKKADLIAALK